MSTDADTTEASGQLITAAEVMARLDDPTVRLIDASFELMDPQAGKRLYAAGHIPGAVHLDLDRDLSSEPGARGRHPLPDMQLLAIKLGDSGIGNDHEIVVYDQDGGMFAARAWWLLRHAGHDAVRFLDGGVAEYVRIGGHLDANEPLHAPTTFTLAVAHDMIVTGDEVHQRLNDPTLVLLDARAPERYRGEVEPLDAKAGHIPGARNLHYTAALEEGRLLAPSRLAETLRTSELAGADVVAYCGSGVSAAHLILALEVAGLPGVRLYPGSWSEWSADPDRPVAGSSED